MRPGLSGIFMIDWHIQSRSHHCQHCNEPFKDKQTYFTLLFEERQGYSRLDVCEPCWGKGFAVIMEGRSTRQMSQWHGVYVAPPATPPDPIQKESAEGLLRKLVALQSPEHMASCYILAAMLERKRILKVKEQVKRDGRRVFLYEHPKSGDLFTIVDPNLQLNQLEKVQRDVANLLERGIEPAPVDPNAPAAAQTQAPTPDPTPAPIPESNPVLVPDPPPATPATEATPDGSGDAVAVPGPADPSPQPVVG